MTEHLQHKTFVSNVYYHGWFDYPINKEQFSSCLKFNLQPKNIPFEIPAGAAADFGSVLAKNFGDFLQLRFPLID